MLQLALGLSLLTGCGESAPEEPDALVHLFTAETQGRSDLGAADFDAKVLFDVANAPPESWTPMPRNDRPATPAELDAFQSTSFVGQDGVVIGPTGGAWAQLIDLEPGKDYVLDGVLSTRGIPKSDLPGHGADKQGARFGIMLLKKAPSVLAPGRVFAQELESHWAPAVRGDAAGASSRIFFRTGPRVRAAVLVAVQLVPSESEQASTLFSEFKLTEQGLGDHLQRAALDRMPQLSAETVAFGRYSIRHVNRPGVFVPPGGETVVQARAPRGPARFEVFAGLVPNTTVADGLPARMSCRVSLASEPEAPLLSLDVDVSSNAAAEARWHPLIAELPERARGELLEFRFRTEAEVGPILLPVFGSARMIPASARRPGPNIVLISLDTLRADRLGCYGYERPTSPRLDAFAEGALRFETAWTQGPYTLPSHMSMMTGQFPSVHGMFGDLDRLDGVRSTLLAEHLRPLGYQTAAFTGGGYVRPDFGFARGFDHYGVLEPLANLESPRTQAMIERGATVTNEMFVDHGLDAIERWVADNAEQPFFLFFHTYAAHTFDPPAEHLRALGVEPVSRTTEDVYQVAMSNWDLPPAEVLAGMNDLYDATVHQVDAAVGRVLDALDTNGLSENTIVIVTADHGKEIGERGVVAHGHSLHEELTRVPMIVRVPGEPARVVKEPAMLVDVAPTVLARLGLERAEGVQGVDLLGSLRPRPLFAEVDSLVYMAAMLEDGVKTIHAPTEALTKRPSEVALQIFDLEQDPGELQPLEPDDARRERLVRYQESLRELADSLAGEDVEAGALNDETRAHLEELGYLVGDG